MRDFTMLCRTLVRRGCTYIHSLLLQHKRSAYPSAQLVICDAKTVIFHTGKRVLGLLLYNTATKVNYDDSIALLISKP